MRERAESFRLKIKTRAGEHKNHFVFALSAAYRKRVSGIIAFEAIDNVQMLRLRGKATKRELHACCIRWKRRRRSIILLNQ